MTTATTPPTSNGHPSELYQPTQTAKPIGAAQALEDQWVEFFHEHGYLAVSDLFSPEQINAALQTIDDLITGKRENYQGASYEKAAAEAGIENLTPDQRRDKVRKLAFSGVEATTCGLPVDQTKMIEIVRRLIGGVEPELFQTMTLLKPPKIGKEKPWHQDHAYFDLDLNDRIVGVWIALDHATLDNGCMQVLDGGHKLGPIHHWKRRDWQICDTDMLGRESVAAPLAPGGALFFDSLLPHGTPTNRSPSRRRAMQFHYAPTGRHAIATEDRLAVFGTEGKDVEC